jgi:hypothetical protein
VVSLCRVSPSYLCSYSLSLNLSISISLHLYLSLSPSLSISLSLSLSISPPLNLSISLSPSLPLCLSPPLSQSLDACVFGCMTRRVGKSTLLKVLGGQVKSGSFAGSHSRYAVVSTSQTIIFLSPLFLSFVGIFQKNVYLRALELISEKVEPH